MKITLMRLNKSIQRLVCGLPLLFVFVLSNAKLCKAQNLVPNPSFENGSNCFAGMPDITCTDNWDITPSIAAMNTADVCFNSAVFFPPSSIPAFHGNNYIGVDCQPLNSEYVQVELVQSMVAGKSYCVSFYASMCDQTLNPATSLGVYFSDAMLTINPYDAGLTAHVQGNVVPDPTVWTKISGVYVAHGGERFITMGGFENFAPQPEFKYMYMDMIEVYEMPSAQITTLEICPNATLDLSASITNSNYLWSTGETTESIQIISAGIYSVEQSFGACMVKDSFLVTASFSCDPDTNQSSPPVIVDQTLFIPSAFSPNGDGANDYFSIYGEGLTELSVFIYNRWGELIFTSNNLNFAWDGKHQGKDVAPDVYVYHLRYLNAKHVREIRSGKIVLLR